MRHRLLLQSPSGERGAAGQAKRTFVDVATVWASIEPQRGRELFAGEKFANEITVVVRMRFRQGVNETWRAVRNTPSQGIEYYGFLGIVRPYGVAREMVVACKQMTTGEGV